MKKRQKGRQRWSIYCRKWGHFVTEHMIKHGKTKFPAIPVDWLAFAIDRIGGPVEAERKLGVSRATVYGWIQNGLGSASFNHVIAISQAADLPLEWLKHRAGPFKFGWPPEVDNDNDNESPSM